jgi:hypothetical protein
LKPLPLDAGETGDIVHDVVPATGRMIKWNPCRRVPCAALGRRVV